MKITYLFGAGASAGNQELLKGLYEEDKKRDDPEGIPVVKNFNKDIANFILLLKDSGMRSEIIQDQRLIELLDEFIKLTEELYSEFKDKFSFDTFAKQLFEKGEIKKLNSLKIVLKCYMVYRQMKSIRDRRYDLFFASLIEDRKISPDLSFLSWNYDTQIEMSLSTFSKKGSRNMNYLDFIETPPYHFGQNRISNPRLIKLNGSLGYELQEDDSKVNRFFTGEDNEDLTPLGAVIYTFRDFKHGVKSAFHFSFEDSDYRKSYWAEMVQILNKTELLIAIGYSFPTLNRKIDSLLIKSIPQTSKIMVQSHPNNFADIKSRIISISGDPRISERITKIENIDEFYIPFQLN